jgi:hypothetical protein
MQLLAEQGFPPELISKVSSLASSKGMSTIELARQNVMAATPGSTSAQTQAYMQSSLAKERQLQARIAMRNLNKGVEFSGWQQRLREAQSQVEMLAAEGKDDFLMKDDAEAVYLAYQGMIQDLNKQSEALRQIGTPQAMKRAEINERLATILLLQKGDLTAPGMSSITKRHGYENYQIYEKAMEESQQIIIHYHNDTIYTPVVRDPNDFGGPRTEEMY